MGRRELDMVGVQVRHWVRGKLLDGAAMVGEHRAHSRSSRRGRGWSGVSISFFCQKLFDDGSGVYGSPLVELVGVREAVYEGVSSGEARAPGAGSAVLARGR